MRSAVLQIEQFFSIDCDEVEYSIPAAANVKVHAEFDWLIYSAPKECVRIVLNGGLESYLKQAAKSDPGAD